MAGPTTIIYSIWCWKRGMKCFKRWKIQKTYLWNGCKGSLEGNYFKVVGTKGSVGCWCWWWCCKSKLASCILQAVRLKFNVYVWVDIWMSYLCVQWVCVRTQGSIWECLCLTVLSALIPWRWVCEDYTETMKHAVFSILTEKKPLIISTEWEREYVREPERKIIQ